MKLKLAYQNCGIVISMTQCSTYVYIYMCESPKLATLLYLKPLMRVSVYVSQWIRIGIAMSIKLCGIVLKPYGTSEAKGWFEDDRWVLLGL